MSAPKPSLDMEILRNENGIITGRVRSKDLRKHAGHIRVRSRGVSEQRDWRGKKKHDIQHGSSASIVLGAGATKRWGLGPWQYWSLSTTRRKADQERVEVYATVPWAPILEVDATGEAFGPDPWYNRIGMF